MKGWGGTMEEKDMDKEFKRLKKGIEDGWLFNDFDEESDDTEENELPLNKENVFEKYKRINKEKIDK